MQNTANVSPSVQNTSASPADQTAPVTPSLASAPAETSSTVAQSAPAQSVPQVSSESKGTMSKATSNIFLLLCVIVIIGGVATGAGLNKLQAQSKNSEVFQGQRIQKVAGSDIQNGQVFGSANEKDFKDSAEGYLQIGGVDGEGSHSLLRDGGVSQTVYLTSSVTDLDKFQGMRVKVWGETFKAQKAGWLMDVGRVQIISTQAEAPAGATTQGAKTTAPVDGD